MTDELKSRALAVAVRAIYFDDPADFGEALWAIVGVLGGHEAVDLLDADGEAAYKRYSIEE